MGVFFTNIGVGILVAMAMGLASSMLFGGFGIIWHFTVRLFIKYQSQIPLNIVPFLNETVNLDLMYRVGGGYVFIHRLLQDYFANLPTNEK